MEDERILKILILEDNENDILLIERVLSKDNLSFISECVDTREEFTEAIIRFKPDVVLSDHGLPQFNSHEALKICAREKAFVPFILVTGTMSDEFAIAILKSGADDYILKSNLSRLPSAIRRALKERRLAKLKREARFALRKQNKELLKLNTELDNFVYSVSHNLRGPIASVKGLLTIAQTFDCEKGLVSVHSMMASSILKLDETLREILEYSKNSRNEIQLEEINWAMIINSSLEKLQYLNKGHNIRKLIQSETDVPFYSDSARMETVFANVLSNAMIYSDKKAKPVIDIEVLTTEEMASIVITDNGIGIHSSVLAHVCDMFYRGAEDSHGAGLGLYITKETVLKLRGHMEITSEFGKGTTTTITLPNLLA